MTRGCLLPKSHSGFLSGDGRPHFRMDSRHEALSKASRIAALGCSAFQLKKLHFFAKPGFKYFDIKNRIANKCVSGNQVNPEEGSCPDKV